MCIFGIFVKYQKVMITYFHSWAFCFVPLIYMPVFMPVPCWFYFYSYAIYMKSGVVIVLALFFWIRIALIVWVCLCLSIVSAFPVAVMKHCDPKQHGLKGFISPYNSTLQHWGKTWQKHTQGRNLEAGMKEGPWRLAASWLVPHGLLNLLSYYSTCSCQIHICQL